MFIYSRFSPLLTKYIVSSSLKPINSPICVPLLLSKDKPSLKHVRHNMYFTNFKTEETKRNNYFAILGVPRNTNPLEIKKAYFELGNKFHPQRNKFDPVAQINFKLISEAYEILSDTKKRKYYEAGKDLKFISFQPSDPEELFRATFGDYNSGQEEFKEYSSVSGINGIYEVSVCLTLKEAAKGIKKEIPINDALVTCPNCRGVKSETEDKSSTCSHCNGTGFEVSKSGVFHEQIKCTECYGLKKEDGNNCNECKGVGAIVKPQTFVLSIPSGITDGQTVQEQFGSQSIRARITVVDSKDFRRDDNDVHSDVNVSLSQAMMGGTITVEGLYEDTTVEITPSSSPGAIIKLEGKGIGNLLSGKKGDHYLHLQVNLPEDLNQLQMEQLKAFAELEKDKKSSSWKFWLWSPFKKSSKP